MGPGGRSRLGGRKILGTAVGVLCGALALSVGVGMVAGLDRETHSGTVPVNMLLLHEVAGLAALAVLGFTIWRAVRTARGEPAGTMVFGLLASLAFWALWVFVYALAHAD